MESKFGNPGSTYPPKSCPSTPPPPYSHEVISCSLLGVIPVCGIDTYPKVWEEGREKQTNKLAEKTPAKAHGNVPADLPGPPT